MSEDAKAGLSNFYLNKDKNKDGEVAACLSRESPKGEYAYPDRRKDELLFIGYASENGQCILVQRPSVI